MLDDRVEQLGDAVAGLGADPQHVLGPDPEHLLDLRGAAIGIGGRQVELVEAGDDLEVVLEGEVAVRERLRLDALGRVDQEDHALAGGQRPRDLVAEVDVARRVDQVDDVVPVVEPDRLQLDRDAPLALDVHRVEVLGPHVPGVDGTAQLEEAVGERALPVVDVRHDGQVAKAAEVHGESTTVPVLPDVTGIRGGG